MPVLMARIPSKIESNICLASHRRKILKENDRIRSLQNAEYIFDPKTSWDREEKKKPNPKFQTNILNFTVSRTLDL